MPDTGLDERAYCVGFSRVSGVGAIRLRRLLETFSSLEEAWHAGIPELRAAGLDQRTARALEKTRTTLDLADELQSLERHHVEPLVWDDKLYPRRLKEIYDPPIVLFKRGDLEIDDEWAVAIVGTRRTTAYGTQVAEQFASELAGAGITIVSGLAHGIDSIAHAAALGAGGRTLAIQACGLDLVYPRDNMELAQRITRQGALLTEHPLGIRPTASNFPMRNRIISGLSLGVLVVEGDERSGALITARQALDQNRDVFAIPGGILSSASAGPNKLIRDGEAKLVRSAGEILEELNLRMALPLAVTDASSPSPTRAPAPTTTSDEAAVLAHLSSDPLHIDDVAVRANMDVAAVSGLLTILELRGITRQVGALHYVKMQP